MGEVFLLIRIFWYENFFFILNIINLFFRIIFSLYLYVMLQYGKGREILYRFNKIEVNEFFILMFYWIPLNIYVILRYLFYLNSLKNIRMWS